MVGSRLVQAMSREIEALKAERNMAVDKVRGLQMEVEALIEQQKRADNYASSLVERIQLIAAMKLNVNGQVVTLFPCDQPCSSSFSSNLW